MPLPDAMVHAVTAALWAAEQFPPLAQPSVTNRAPWVDACLTAAFAWLHSDAPEAVEMRARMVDAWIDHEGMAAGGLLAAFAVLTGDEVK